MQKSRSWGLIHWYLYFNNCLKMWATWVHPTYKIFKIWSRKKHISVIGNSYLHFLLWTTVTKEFGGWWRQNHAPSLCSIIHLRWFFLQKETRMCDWLNLYELLPKHTSLPMFESQACYCISTWFQRDFKFIKTLCNPSAVSDNTRKCFARPSTVL